MLMLQQPRPSDFVIATGRQFSVRDFVNAAAAALGLRLEWRGQGLEETAVVAAVDAASATRAAGGKECTSHVKEGETIYGWIHAIFVMARGQLPSGKQPCPPRHAPPLP